MNRHVVLAVCGEGTRYVEVGIWKLGIESGNLCLGILSIMSDV